MSDRCTPTARARVLVVGAGSPHGDDRLGWLGAELFGEGLGEEGGGTRVLGVRVERLQTPVDLLGLLEEEDRLERLVVCDAVRRWPPGEQAERSRIHCWRWPTKHVARLRSALSHGLGLPDVLQTAATLGRLPRDVRLVAIEGFRFGPLDPPTPAAQRVLPALVAMLRAASLGTCEQTLPDVGWAPRERLSQQRGDDE